MLSINWKSLQRCSKSTTSKTFFKKREKSGNKFASLTFLGTVIKFMSSRCFWEGGCRINGGKWVHEERGGGGRNKGRCMYEKSENNREVGGRLWPKPTSLWEKSVSPAGAKASPHSNTLWLLLHFSVFTLALVGARSGSSNTRIQSRGSQSNQN